MRSAQLSAPCSTCLLEGATIGPCSPGEPCCPDPDFARSVLECASSCADSTGVNPAGDHPICVDLCATDEAECSTDAEQCFDACNARIQGVSGLCALCLLEGASSGGCNGDGPCCPDPDYPASAEACASVCGG